MTTSQETAAGHGWPGAAAFVVTGSPRTSQLANALADSYAGRRDA